MPQHLTQARVFAQAQKIVEAFPAHRVQNHKALHHLRFVQAPFPLLDFDLLPHARGQSKAAKCPHQQRYAATGARAVTSLAQVALISLEPASPELSGAHVMARALDALDRANVEALGPSSSSYRQNFCFLVRTEELAKSRQALESALALELAHNYVYPIQVDEKVGLLAVVGEAMEG